MSDNVPPSAQVDIEVPDSQVVWDVCTPANPSFDIPDTYGYDNDSTQTHDTQAEGARAGAAWVAPAPPATPIAAMAAESATSLPLPPQPPTPSQFQTPTQRGLEVSAEILEVTPIPLRNQGEDL